MDTTVVREVVEKIAEMIAAIRELGDHPGYTGVLWFPGRAYPRAIVVHVQRRARISGWQWPVFESGTQPVRWFECPPHRLRAYDRETAACVAVLYAAAVQGDQRYVVNLPSLPPMVRRARCCAEPYVVPWLPQVCLGIVQPQQFLTRLLPTERGDD